MLALACWHGGRKAQQMFHAPGICRSENPQGEQGEGSIRKGAKPRVKIASCLESEDAMSQAWMGFRSCVLEKRDSMFMYTID